MAKKSVILDEYIVQVEDNNHVDVFRIFDNVIASLREASNSVGYNFDPKWNTRTFGTNLIKEYGEGNSAQVGNFFITKRENGSIETYRSFDNTKEALKGIAKAIEFDVDSKWTTQQLGNKLVDYITNNRSSLCVRHSDLAEDAPQERMEDNLQIPNNEIWYTADQQFIKTSNKPWFDAEIEEQTFDGGKGVIKFKGDVTTICKRAFLTDVFDFKSITLPESITTIASNNPFHDTVKNIEAFYGKFSSEDHRCFIIDGRLLYVASLNIEEFAIPEGVEIISSSAFPPNNTIQHLIIPQSCTTIESCAFQNLSNLRRITFKGSISELGSCTFSSNSLLEYIEGPQVKEDHKCFVVNKTLFFIVGSDSIDEFTLPSGIERIASGAFGKNTKIKHLIIPKECKIINGLSSPHIEKITFLGEVERVCLGYNPKLEVFEGPSVSEDGRCVIIDNEIKAFAGANLTTYTIPLGIVDFDGYIFSNYKSLKKIIVPDSVKGDNQGNPLIYQDLEADKEIYFMSTIPTPYDSDNCCEPSSVKDGVIYVPSEAIEDYKDAEGWEDYVDCIKPIPKDFVIQ